jgi:hypothetical protein
MDCSGTIFQGIAKMRWAGYTVTGDGKIAVVLHCRNEVRLCDWLMEAEDIAAKSCIPDMCSHIALGPSFKMHQIHVLNTPPVASPQYSTCFDLGWE